MLNKIDFFFNLYLSVEGDVFKFVFSKKEHNFYRKEKGDIIINNSIYCFFHIYLETIHYYKQKEEYKL